MSQNSPARNCCLFGSLGSMPFIAAGIAIYRVWQNMSKSDKIKRGIERQGDLNNKEAIYRKNPNSFDAAWDFYKASNDYSNHLRENNIKSSQLDDYGYSWAHLESDVQKTILGGVGFGLTCAAMWKAAENNSWI